MGVADMTSTWGKRTAVPPFGGQRRPLGHAEPVLLVSDDQPQAGEVHP